MALYHIILPDKSELLVDIPPNNDFRFVKRCLELEVYMLTGDSIIVTKILPDGVAYTCSSVGR